MLLFRLLILGVCFIQISGQAHYIKFHHSPNENQCTIVEQTFLPNYRGLHQNGGFKYSTKPAVKVVPGTHYSPSEIDELHDNAKIVEIHARTKDEAIAFMRGLCKTYRKVEPVTVDKFAPEIRKIVDGGDQKNRIDVVFMGDGYTAAEKEDFFADMERLTKDMFEGVTFRSYLPLFNIWAIYVESEESGIGYTGPKNTPFRLYRERGQLRGIFPGNSQYARQVCALTGSSGCDYPSIIGNDDFYGGLGGEFVISTKSNRTGTVVLRHEMGHNFADVGEEYDDGGVYSGVNTARSLDTLGWTNWLSGAKREERAIYRILEYPWKDLSEGSQSFQFTSDGQFSRWYLEVTVSAAGEEDSLEFTLDGEVLPWKTSGFDDREFYGWSGNAGFSSGSHSFTVRSKTASTHPDIPRMICSISLHEYGSEEEFVMSPNHVSAYPTWDAWRTKHYRPTNEWCLMRNMTHDRLCPICQEGMWSEFLEQISLIDTVQVSETPLPDGKWEVTVQALNLGQYRVPGNEVPGETLEIRWFHNGNEQADLKDKIVIAAEAGNWEVEVHLNSPEVRHDPRNLLTSTAKFVVPDA